MIRWFAAAVLVVALGLAGWFGYRAVVNRAPPPPARIEQLVPEGATPGIETVQTEEVASVQGSTPMAQRVAVVGLLNKRNGESRDLTLKPGQAVRVGDAIVRLRACERTAPWEPEMLTGSFVQLDVRGADRHWRRAFSGWLFKERPGLNVVQHPVYDVWSKSCTMSFPATGPATETLAAPRRSSAPKSPRPAPDDTPAPTTPDSAVSSNAT